MVVAKTRKGKAHENRTKEGPRTRVRTSGRTNSIPGWPSLHRAGPAGRIKKNIKRGAKELGVSLSLFSSSLLGQHAFMPWGCIFLYFLNKTDLQHGTVSLICPRAVTWSVQGLWCWSLASNFCCDETEPKKLHTPLTYTNRNYSAWKTKRKKKCVFFKWTKP